MKKRMRKRLAVVVSFGLIIVTSLLGGCKSKDETKEPDGTGVVKIEVSGRTSKSKETEKTSKHKREDKEGLKLFETKDESFSIYFDEDWISEGFDNDEDNWLCAGSKDGAEAVVVMQFPKGHSKLSMENMDEVKEFVIKSYEITDIEELGIPYLPVLKSKEAYKGIINADTGTYIVYGETDYAFYCLLYATDELDNKKIRTIGECFATLKEDN